MFVASSKDPEKRSSQVLELNYRLADKLTSLGIKRKSIMMATSDLADIYFYAMDIKRYIDLFLSTPKSDSRRLGQMCVDLGVTLGQLKDHIADSRKPLEYLGDFCYEKAKKDVRNE